MPASFEKKVKARGGAIAWRVKKLPGGKLLREAIVRKPGPRGGKVVAYVEKQRG